MMEFAEKHLTNLCDDHHNDNMASISCMNPKCNRSGTIRKDQSQTSTTKKRRFKCNNCHSTLSTTDYQKYYMKSSNVTAKKQKKLSFELQESNVSQKTTSQEPSQTTNTNIIQATANPPPTSSFTLAIPTNRQVMVPSTPPQIASSATRTLVPAPSTTNKRPCQSPSAQGQRGPSSDKGDQLTLFLQEMKQEFLNLKTSILSELEKATITLVEEKCDSIFEEFAERLSTFSNTLSNRAPSTSSPVSPTKSRATYADIVSLDKPTIVNLTEFQKTAQKSIFQQNLPPTHQEPPPSRPFYRQFTEREKRHGVVPLYVSNIQHGPIKKIRNALGDLGIRKNFLLNISFISPTKTEILVPLPYAAVAANILNRNSFTIITDFAMDAAWCSSKQLQTNKKRLSSILERGNPHPSLTTFLEDWIQSLESRIPHITSSLQSDEINEEDEILIRLNPSIHPHPRPEHTLVGTEAPPPATKTNNEQ